MNSVERLEQVQFPTSKDENWRYADLNFFKSVEYSETSPLANAIFYEPDKQHLVVQLNSNNQKSPLQITGTLPPGLDVSWTFSPHAKTKISVPVSSDFYFANIPAVTQAPCLNIKVDKNFSKNTVLEIRFSIQGQTTHLHPVQIKLDLAEESEALCFQTMNPGSAAMPSVEVMLNKKSKLQWLNMDTQEKAPAIIQTFQAQIKEQAELTLMTATAGRSWSRHNIGIELLEENSKANIRSCGIAGSQQYVDQSSFIHHRAINTSSSQVAHGIATDHAKIVFNGKIQIHRDAQKSQTSQMARHLLLSQQAQVNAKPELFIDADDVKAAHGATVGPMDAEEFFYLQSRGLTAKQARELLGRGFILSVTEGLHSRLQAPLVDSLQAALVSTLDAT